MDRFAPIFLSHGSPMTALGGGAAAAFWRELGQVLEARAAPPTAIVVVSAHSLARRVTTLAAPRHAAVHDFGGFPPALYELRYDVSGAPALASRVEALLAGAGIEADRHAEGGLDHGIWVPLRALRPAADLPVLPLAFPPDWSPQALFAFGAALAPLVDEGVLVVGSGSITHNLRLGLPAAGREVPERTESAEFRAWFAQRAASRDWSSLWDWRAQAPHAAFMHPTDEHLLPWFVAAGAGGRCHFGVRIHDSVEGGHIGMDAYAFGPEARTLADELAALAGA
jgi:4,5-DOPA dioxygenase extradiol